MLMICLRCGNTWIYTGKKEIGNFTNCPNCNTSVKIDDAIDKRIFGGNNMAKIRYLQLFEGKMVGAGSDRTILDDIAKILTDHGRFLVVRDSLVFSVTENPLWKEKQEIKIQNPTVTSKPSPVTVKAEVHKPVGGN